MIDNGHDSDSTPKISNTQLKKIRRKIREDQIKPILPAPPIPQDPFVLVTWGPAAPSAPPNQAVRIRIASWLHFIAIHPLETDPYPAAYPGHLATPHGVSSPTMMVSFNVVWRIFGAINAVQLDATLPAGHLATLLIHGTLAHHTMRLIR
eukprot:TRINITY_DN25219_c0_g1_i2.p1 TRINITY_DN25219_c0_g1~~TRINITY_DN25219_c0_g1_i2.p1  ORF type:complete len:150 (-),score=9.53 TRINITY_DN25219_c0_g1_i2:35-484(-)